MANQDPIIVSKRVWGGALAGIFGGAVPLLMYAEILKEGLPTLITAGGALVGGLMSIWSKFKTARKG